MSLERLIEAKTLLDVVENIRQVQKKKVGWESITREVQAFLGLAEDDICRALKDLGERGILIFHDDGVLVELKEKLT